MQAIHLLVEFVGPLFPRPICHWQPYWDVWRCHHLLRYWHRPTSSARIRVYNYHCWQLRFLNSVISDECTIYVASFLHELTSENFIDNFRWLNKNKLPTAKTMFHGNDTFVMMWQRHDMPKRNEK